MMEKGKFGVTMAFYGVTAFLLAALGYFTPLILLTGVVLLVEKNEWATRQALQACCICLISDIINRILGSVDVFYRIPVLGSIWSGTIGILTSIVSIIAIVFALIGLVRNVKGKEAGIPLAERFANWAFGVIAVKTTTYQQTQQDNQNRQ